MALNQCNYCGVLPYAFREDGEILFLLGREAIVPN